jgi:hypothetical protein
MCGHRESRSRRDNVTKASVFAGAIAVVAAAVIGATQSRAETFATVSPLARAEYGGKPVTATYQGLSVTLEFKSSTDFGSSISDRLF